MNIKNLRKRKGLTQKQLAEMCDLSESMISNLESGKKLPSFETLLKLAEALECSTSDIIDNKKIPITEGDGQNLLDLSQLNKEQRKLIEDVLRLNPQQRSAVLSVTESFLSNK